MPDASRRVVADLFAEDSAHEQYLVPLARRVAAEDAVFLHVRVRSARGGLPTALKEYRGYQRILQTSFPTEDHPDLIIVAIDANCRGWNARADEIREATLPQFREKLVTACPDPHIERWYTLVPSCFEAVIGVQPVAPAEKCERGVYKASLSDSTRRAGHPPSLGGLEFAYELAHAVDLFAAGKSDSSFRAFVRDLRAALKTQAR